MDGYLNTKVCADLRAKRHGGKEGEAGAHLEGDQHNSITTAKVM